MATVLGWLGVLAFAVGPFAVLAAWAFLADERDKLRAFLRAWLGILLLQAVLAAVGWSPVDEGTRLASALVGSSSSWLTGPVLALNFGPQRRVVLAITLFAVAWFVTVLAGGLAALVSGQISI